MDTKEKVLSKGNGGDSTERDMGPELNASLKVVNEANLKMIEFILHQTHE